MFSFFISVPKNLIKELALYIFIIYIPSPLQTQGWEAFNLFHGECWTMFCFNLPDKSLEPTGLSSYYIGVYFCHQSPVIQFPSLWVKGKANLLSFSTLQTVCTKILSEEIISKWFRVLHVLWYIVFWKQSYEDETDSSI